MALPSDQFRFKDFETNECNVLVVRSGIVVSAMVDRNSDLEAVTVNITIETQLPEPSEDGDTDGPSFISDWLAIPVDHLKSRDATMLDGLQISYPAGDGNDFQPPAGIGFHMFGMVDQMKLSLKHVSGATYLMHAKGTAEYGRAFSIDCQLALSEVCFGPYEPDDHSATEIAYARLVDPALSHSDWVVRGSKEYPLHYYVGHFDFAAGGVQ